MTTYSNSTERLVTFHVGAMSRTLALAGIEQFGGEDTFYEVASDIVNNGFADPVDGFFTEDDFLDFYEKNKTEILSFITKTARKLHFSCSFDMLAGLDSMNNLLTMEEIAVALYDDDSEYRATVARATALLVAECLAYSYQKQVEFDERRQYS